MGNQIEDKQIAGVDYATFLGVILEVVGSFGILAIALSGVVPTLAMGALAGSGAAVFVLGHAMIAKGMGYRAVFSSIKQHAGLWLLTAAMAAAGGSFMIGTTAQLMQATG
jgi:hypothetical protein